MRSSCMKTYVQSKGSNTHMAVNVTIYEQWWWRVRMLDICRPSNIYIYPFIVCLLLINLKASLIDLFTNMTAILNLLDWRSIMGCLVGTCSVFMCAWAKRASLYSSQKKGNHYYIQTQHNNLFLRKLKEKLARKVCVYILSKYIRSCSCPLGIP